MYYAQYFDTDTESWEDMDEVQPSNNRQRVADDARYEARKCAYRVKTRVVGAKDAPKTEQVS